MYIEPNTNIKILHNVPLENTYDHTLYFETANAQYTYFASMVKYNLVHYTYQRVNKGRMRVQGKADNYYDCNYLMFQNTNFGNKWFYAFINSVEYINNETTEIEFEIDVIQTWLFDADVEECFVERQHSLSDAIGDNIVPETLNCGEYVFNSYEPITAMTDMCVCLAIVDTDGGSSGTLYDGIYGSATLYVYDSTDVSSINDKIDEYNQKPAVTKNDTLDGYLPKNGKMYTYPYNYFHVDNASGGDLTLRYEFFENRMPTVEIGGTVTLPVNLTCRPDSYKGVAGYDPLGGYTSLNTEVLQLGNYPMCSWNVDAYQAWVAQNSIPIGLNAISTLGQSIVASTYSANPAGAVAGGSIGLTSNLLSQWYTASIQADISKGSFNNGGANTALGKQKFYCGRASVNRQYAKIIDDYFTMYGYAEKCISRLHTHARPHWSYVKTVGCTARGSIPSDDMKRIISIYDKGITFWKNANEVGNYSLDNSLNQ